MTILQLDEAGFRELVLEQKALRERGKPDQFILGELKIDRNDLRMIDRILSLDTNSLQALRPTA